MYRKTVSDYSEQIHILAQKLLGLIAESLGLPSSSIKDAIGEFYQNITVSYYPPCPQPELTLGLQSHSDIGAITLIIQDDVGGLEILKDGEWIPMNPLPHAIVVILADQTEVLFIAIAFISRVFFFSFFLFQESEHLLSVNSYLFGYYLQIF